MTILRVTERDATYSLDGENGLGIYGNNKKASGSIRGLYPLVRIGRESPGLSGFLIYRNYCRRPGYWGHPWVFAGQLSDLQAVWNMSRGSLPQPRSTLRGKDSQLSCEPGIYKPTCYYGSIIRPCSHHASGGWPASSGGFFSNNQDGATPTSTVSEMRLSHAEVADSR